MQSTRLIQFGLVSGLGWILDFLVFILLIRLHVDPSIANALGASLAVLWVYLVSVRRIFQCEGGRERRRFAAYAAFQLFAIIIASWAVGEIILHTAIHPLVAKFVVTPATFLANYLFMAWLTSPGESRQPTLSAGKPRILVFVPMYECERRIARVLERIREHLGMHIQEVLVVDNGSRDGSCTVAAAALANLGVPGTLLQNDRNINLGGSHKVAFAYAVAGGFDWIVVVHGDDQADPADLAPLITAGCLHDGIDALLGSRFDLGSRRSGYAWHRTWGNMFFNALFTAVSGRRVGDLGSGLNAFRVAWIREAAWLNLADDLTFNVHLLLLLVHRRAGFRFFPISWREDGQVSQVQLLRQACKTIGIAWGYAWRRGAYLADVHNVHGVDAYGFSVRSENGLKRAIT